MSHISIIINDKFNREIFTLLVGQVWKCVCNIAFIDFALFNGRDFNDNTRFTENGYRHILKHNSAFVENNVLITRINNCILGSKVRLEDLDVSKK